MKVIEPYIVPPEDIDGDKCIWDIVKAAQICYKSERNMTFGEAKDFVRRLIKNKHYAMLEHAPSLSIKFICDRGIANEIVRHRLFSLAQECLTGDTEVRKGVTVEQLYNREYHGTSYDRTHNRTIRLRSCDEHGNIIPNQMLDVLYKGICEVYEVTTSRGYKIKTTMNHKFMTKNGEFETLDELKIGDIVMVNGRPSLLRISDENLTHAYLVEGLTPLEIADEFDAPYKSVLRRLQALGIFKTHMNDKDVGKYNRQHTSESYEKMRQSVIKGYRDGRIVWNKGVREGEHPSVDKQADVLRKHHYNNQSGSLSSNWKGGISTRHYMRLKSNISHCEICGSTNRLEIHHKDSDRQNNDINNLIKLCENCHELQHRGWHVGVAAVGDTIVSIKYIGQQSTYDLVMASPYNNYIANGFIVHNSTRYCKYTGGIMTFILPCWFSEQGKNVLLNNHICIDYEHMQLNVDIDNGAENIWTISMANTEAGYNLLVEKGTAWEWTPQQARSILPNSLKTELIVTGNVREWRHFFDLRTAKDSHPQMQQVAKMALRWCRENIPVIFDDVGVID